MTSKQRKQRKATYEGDHDPNTKFSITLTKDQIDHTIAWFEELRPQINRISDEEEGENQHKNEIMLNSILDVLRRTDIVTAHDDEIIPKKATSRKKV